MRLSIAGFFVALLGGCCADAEPCPDNTVVIHVDDDGAPVADVTVTGGGAQWSCAMLATETLCSPEAIANGVYLVTLEAPGYPTREVEVDVRTWGVPPFSCDCEVPTANVFVDWAPAAAPLDGGV